MKKIYSLLAVLALAGMTSANAQKWDFTNWSAETVANLKAVNAANTTWSDIEKVDGTEPTETSKDNCFWQVDVTATVDADGNLTANGQVIKELKGLKYKNTNNRSLAIAVNYPTALSDYKGGSYLWLGSQALEYFAIPDVPAGATIKMGVESHKASDARGVMLFLTEDGHVDASGKKPVLSGEGALKDKDGNAVAVPKTYTEQEWVVPADAAATNDVYVFNSNGCHLYYIEVVGSTGGVEDITVAEDENAPMYNLQGVQVDENYKGVVVKNGKKYINR